MQSKNLTFPRGLMQILSNIRQFPQLFIEKANWDSLYLVRKGGGGSGKYCGWTSQKGLWFVKYVILKQNTAYFENIFPSECKCGINFFFFQAIQYVFRMNESKFNSYREFWTIFIKFQMFILFLKCI